jgi:hypothetical protein
MTYTLEYVLKLLNWDSSFKDPRLEAIIRNFNCFIRDKDDVKLVKIINIVFTYEWDYELEDKPRFWLSFMLDLFECFPVVFQVTDKLKQMLQEIKPKIDTTGYVSFKYNENLLDLCNDVGLLTRDGLTITSWNREQFFRKGILLYEDSRLFKYIKSVMITN